MSTIHIVKESKVYDDYGIQKNCAIYCVTYYQSKVDHYPNSGKTTITSFTGYTDNLIETVTNTEIAWLSVCGCQEGLDIHEGYYAYLANKYWKIVGTRVYEDCGCYDIRLTLQRLEPRETKKDLIECINCFHPNLKTNRYIRGCDDGSIPTNNESQVT